MRTKPLCSLFLLLYLAFAPAWGDQGQGTTALPGSQTALYTVTDLGKSGDFSMAEGINNQGQVVGWEGHGGSRSGGGFLWDKGQQQIITQAPFEAAYGINNNDEVVGIPGEMSLLLGSLTKPNPFDIMSGSSGFVWAKGRLSYLTGFSNAYAINDQGQIAGESSNEAAIWQKRRITGPLADTPDIIWNNVRPQHIPNLPGYQHGIAYDINNHGEAVGVMLRSNTNIPENGCAFRFLAGTATLLATPPGGSSAAFAINAGGTIAGMVRNHGSPWDAASWDRTGIPHPLPALAGYTHAVAHSINSSAQMVGWAYNTGGSSSAILSVDPSAHPATHACLWENGRVIDLNSVIPANSGWVLQVANAINDHGEIVGGGSIHGEYHAFLLTPTALR